MNVSKHLLIASAALIGGLLGLGQQVFAQGKGLDEPFRADYYKKLEGKTGSRASKRNSSRSA